MNNSTNKYTCEDCKFFEENICFQKEKNRCTLNNRFVSRNSIRENFVHMYAEDSTNFFTDLNDEYD